MKFIDAMNIVLKGNRYQSTADMFPIVIRLTGSRMKLSTFEREWRRNIHKVPHRVKVRVGINNALYNVFIKIVGEVG